MDQTQLVEVLKETIERQRLHNLQEQERLKDIIDRQQIFQKQQTQIIAILAMGSLARSSGDGSPSQQAALGILQAQIGPSTESASVQQNVSQVVCQAPPVPANLAVTAPTPAEPAPTVTTGEGQRDGDAEIVISPPTKSAPVQQDKCTPKIPQKRTHKKKVLFEHHRNSSSESSDFSDEDVIVPSAKPSLYSLASTSSECSIDMDVRRSGRKRNMCKKCKKCFETPRSLTIHKAKCTRK